MRMNNETFFVVSSIISFILTVISIAGTLINISKKHTSITSNKLLKCKDELDKQLIELEKMKEGLVDEKGSSSDDKDYAETIMLIDNLIEQYKNEESQS